MLFYLDNCTDPARNLAAEEYLLANCCEPLLRLWRNSDSVIIGKNQNAWAEVDVDYVGQNNIPVIRRLSGGGAVFHDIGNINYSFFNVSREEASETMISALEQTGLHCEASGRNDILLDGRKISGTAGCISNGHTLHHGTLLFKASMEKLAGALRPRPEKFTGKAVHSVKSRVTNISEHLKSGISTEEFMKELAGVLRAGSVPFEPDAAMEEGTNRLLERKYSRREWNFGHSPHCAFSNVVKFPAGLVELYTDLEEGRFTNIDIRGDYFFRRPTEDFCRMMEGCEATREKTIDRLRGIAVDEYFSGISPDELSELFSI